MKTTVDIAGALLAEAKAVAQARKRTLRELIEEGLRSVIAVYHDNSKEKKPIITPYVVTGVGTHHREWSEIGEILAEDERSRFTP